MMFYSVIFWHRKMTLKVQFWHFLRPWQKLSFQLKLPDSLFSKIKDNFCRPTIHEIQQFHLIVDPKPCFLGPSNLETPWPNWHVCKQYTKQNITYEAYTNIRGVRAEGPTLYWLNKNGRHEDVSKNVWKANSKPITYFYLKSDYLPNIDSCTLK